MRKLAKVAIGIGSLGMKGYDLLDTETGESIPFYADYLHTIISEQVANQKRSQNTIDAIAAEMSQSPMLRTIVFCGIGALLPILRAANINVGEDFNNICHMCWAIFSRSDCVEAIKAHFAEQNVRALNKVIALLEVQSTADEVQPQISL